MTATDIDLDALIDALAARAAARARPLVNAAGDDVSQLAAAGLVTVNPGDLITSQWGNLTYQQTMLVFASVADRNNQWAAAADGAICYTVAEVTVWVRRAGQWIALAFTPNKASCRYLGGGTTSATSNQATIWPFTTKLYDDANAYNTTTGIFTCPYPGIYQVTAQFGFNTAAGAQVNRFVYKNGVSARLSATTTSAAGYSETPVVFADRCVAGDTLAIWLSCSLVSITLRGGQETAMDIVYLGP